MKKYICFTLFAVCAIFAYSFGRIHTDKQLSESFAFPVSLTQPIYTDADSLPQFSGTSARAACLIDAKSGAVLYSYNSDKRLPMASTTKIMTALTVLETLDPDKEITVPKEACGVEGSSIYLYPQEKITVKNLLYGLMLESGNDAASALAYACCGSEEKFAELMNGKAHDLGLIDTHFTNPHGLPDENHYTTAYELALIAAKALENEDFRTITSTATYACKVDGKSASRFFSNHNRLLRSYEGCIGVKTGFTKTAGRCLVSAAERGGRRYVAVTLGDGDDWRDHTAMLDFAFENFGCSEIAPKDSFTIYYRGKAYRNRDGIYLTVSKDENPSLCYKIDFSGRIADTVCFADGAEIGRFALEPDAKQ